jgi:hypothetical protein
MIVPESPEAFESWWYKDDPTHVSLYSKKALVYAAESVKNAAAESAGEGTGLVFEKELSERIFLFRHPF